LVVFKQLVISKLLPNFSGVEDLMVLEEHKGPHTLRRFMLIRWGCALGYVMCKVFVLEVAHHNT